MGRFKARELRDDASPDEVRRQLNEIQKELAADLAVLSADRRVTELQLGDYTARYGDIVRMAPPAAGARLILPPVNLAQTNGRVTLVVESVVGAVTAEAVDTTVNGAATLVFGAGRGTAEFVLTGGGWFCWSVDLDIPSGSIANGKLANISPGRVKGLQIDAAAPAAPVDLTGAEVGELLRLAKLVEYAGAGGTENDYPLEVRTNILRVNPGLTGGDVTFTGFALDGGGATHNAGGFFTFVKQGAANKVIFKNATGSVGNNQLLLPGATDLEVTVENTCFTFHFWGGRWQVGEAPGPAGAAGATGATGTAGATGATGAAGSGGVLALTDFYIRDDFDAYLNVSSISVAGSEGTLGAVLQTGDGNWGVSGNGSIAVVTGEADHPGIIRLTTSSAGGLWIHKGRTTADGVIRASRVTSLKFALRMNDTSNVQYDIGLTSGAYSAATVYMVVDQNTTNNLRGRCGDGTDSTTSFGVAAGLGWNTYEIVNNGSSVDFYLNSVLKATVSSHVPTTQILTPIIGLFSGSGSRSLDVDLFQMQGGVTR